MGFQHETFWRPCHTSKLLQCSDINWLTLPGILACRRKIRTVPFRIEIVNEQVRPWHIVKSLDLELKSKVLDSRPDSVSNLP